MHRSLLLCVLCVCILLVACGRSLPTRYYLLESPHTPMHVDNLPPVNLRLAQVSVPQYLDRNGIVSRKKGSTELIVSQFHAWAEPVATGVRRLLQEGLSAPLLAVGINVPAPGDDAPAEYTLFVDVQRLDGDFHADAVLEIRWTLKNSNDAILGKGIYADREAVPGDTYDALIAAESRMLNRMVAHLAQRLPATLHKK
ncbi:MAG: membrane integrity-associated transporter subunit PqiC [Desulfovibrio sp.]|nr:membrane integrity-associated transporter subunit PqiC [Desulfovibrio sp.]